MSKALTLPKNRQLFYVEFGCIFLSLQEMIFRPMGFVINYRILQTKRGLLG